MLAYAVVEPYLTKKAGATLEYPFGPEAAVFKVGGKMFAVASWQEEPLRLTLKCDPDEAIALRAAHPAITPGYYMNKQHWNTVTLDDTLPDSLVWEMVDASYLLIRSSLTRKQQAELPAL